MNYRHGCENYRYTYRDYEERVRRLAGGLVRLGIRPGDRVATLAWNHRHHLELYLAVPLAGAVLHTVNLRLSAAEIGYIVDHADDQMVIADNSLVESLSIARARRPGMRVVTIDGPANAR